WRFSNGASAKRFLRKTMKLKALAAPNFNGDTEAFDEAVDSSDMSIDHWQRIANLIGKKYKDYDGFVILHGTDTMAYTASALSYMLPNLKKPVILTGSQLPIGVLRTDGKENLITSIQMASMQKDGQPILQEVAIYFGSELFRGNRTFKYSTEDFDAFDSPNYPELANAGIHVFFHFEGLLRSEGEFEVKPKMNDSVAVVKIVPGLKMEVFNAIIGVKGLKGLILETYGSGNAMTSDWFLEAVGKALDKGIVIVNVTQCNRGFVEQGKYETSSRLSELGVVSAGDMTLEATYTKLMHLLSYEKDKGKVTQGMIQPIAGEITNFSALV
ncbi:MAG: asparaginase, partial [Flavobacteriales bacterium]